MLFFPHLLAGPIVHHGQLMPQMRTPAFQRLRAHNLVVGGAIFLVGMAKKVLGADTFVALVGPVFAAATAGQEVTMVEAWTGALAYTLQLYFDFSGYSDMAIGLARMFGIQFPRNFDSPYKATSIVDFWRRWHITLSSFLRDYLYIQLGGNRKGPARRYLNLFLTMLLGGLWHGAGWTFVVWGALHGFYLVVNHAFAALRGGAGLGPAGQHARGQAGGRRADLPGGGGGLGLLPGADGVGGQPAAGGDGGRRGHRVAGQGRGAAGPGGAGSDGDGVGRPLRGAAPGGDAHRHGGDADGGGLRGGVAAAQQRADVRALPGRAARRARGHRRRTARWYHWRPTLLWGVGLGVLLTLSLAAVAGKTEFIYFQF